MQNDRSREIQRAYIEKVLKATGLTATQLMKNIEKAPTTLTRFLNDAEHTHLLSLQTLQAIARYSGMPVPAALFAGSPTSPQGRALSAADRADIMRIVVERVDELIRDEGVTLAPAKRNEIVGLVYEDTVRVAALDPDLIVDAEIGPDKIRRLIALAR